MDSKRITVLARLKAKPGMEEDLRRELLALVKPSRSDAGCISYDLHQEIEDRTSFIFYENWESKAHLDSHLTTPHLQALHQRVDALLAEPIQITLLEKIS